MIKKDNKIYIVVARNEEVRSKMIGRLAIALGFAKIPSDALKIIKNDISAYNLATAYFVMCSSYNFRGSSITTQRLYEMAARGLFICVGVKSLPREYEFIGQVYHEEDLL